MTIEEMKTIKVGDTIKDVARSKTQEREVHCTIESIDDNSVTLVAILAADAGCYPHRFFFTRDADKLGFIEN
jgi:PDZ domain-containing secreted protein